ncbi:CaiB/BaiF CoA transferase family protein [Thioalkalivibrio sp. HK1]|uniref:CaiB/BaiF CoA transferase family protein n=1 Tax=Thioalkalivibrio sp. HK1 TaxID=1469245 RepID=UPI00046E62D5|nr:CaiB/BaiF CoA-transferase family protein [Thioalkalivibrio sp. HK1]
MTPPLEGIRIVDFSQFLAGPYASLKLLDMGARVIKVENPKAGDLCRHIYLSDTKIHGESTLFHAINRGKESIALDLKSPQGLAAARTLITHADLVIQNFRPGVIDRLGLGYEQVKAIKPDIIYGSISGYGDSGQWADLPGQDLLVQARSGIVWLSGNADQGPVPIGLPIADISAGANLAQGLLGALFRKERTGQGALVETSLLEALIDLQFEFLTTYLNNDEIPPERAQKGSAHGYLPAPYGVFETARGHLALAMTPLDKLVNLLGLQEDPRFASGSNAGFTHRNEIHAILRSAFKTKSAEQWESLLIKHDIWCARILNWKEMLRTEAGKALEMLLPDPENTTTSLRHLRTPIRLDGQRAPSGPDAPELDAHGQAICEEFGISRI